MCAWKHRLCAQKHKLCARKHKRYALSAFRAIVYPIRGPVESSKPCDQFLVRSETTPCSPMPTITTRDRHQPIPSPSLFLEGFSFLLRTSRDHTVTYIPMTLRGTVRTAMFSRCLHCLNHSYPLPVHRSGNGVLLKQSMNSVPRAWHSWKRRLQRVNVSPTFRRRDSGMGR